MKRPEQALQISVAQFLAVALKSPTWWSAVDHGAGKMTRASAGLRRARGVKSGIPDIIIIWPENGYPKVLGIELKAGRGTISPMQAGVRFAWRAANADYIVCRSLAEVEQQLLLRMSLHAKLS